MRKLARLIARYLTGRPLGTASTDATYLRRATTSPPGVRGRWAALPGWRRQVVRVGGPVAGWVGARWAADHSWLAGVALVVALVVVGRRAGRRARQARWRATYIRPTLSALRTVVGDAPVSLRVDPDLGTLAQRIARPMSPAEARLRAWYGMRVEPVVRWLPDRVMRARWWVRAWLAPAGRVVAQLRPPRAERAAGITVEVTVPYLTADQRGAVSAIVGAKVPAAELVERWDQVGARVVATWTVRRRPPARVTYADVAAALDRLPEHEFYIGQSAGGRPVTVSLHDDSPHIACSAGSGAGKSVLACLLAVQVLARGGRVVILDIKGSHRWALGLPGVDYCTRPDQMHDALIRLAALADQRNGDALHEAEGWDPGIRYLVIAEELNATMARLRDWWDETRERSDPKVPPAVRAFRALLFMGRSAKINMFAVAQMLTANTTGGPESRENFGTRCLARYTVNAWKMLVPEAAMPRSSRVLGRWQVVTGGEATETQVAYLTAAEARLLVHRRRPVHMDAVTPDGPLTSNVHMDPASHGDTAGPVTLQDSIDIGLCPWPLATAQKRLQRARAADRAAPPPVGKRQRADLYDRAALAEWIESELIKK